jgi:hypothetical protein
MFSDITAEEYAAALDQVAEEVLSEAGIERPPVDVLAVARALNIQVAWDDTQPGRARCVRLQGFNGRPARSTVLLRPDPRPERRQWAMAHEIGEQVAYRVFATLGVDPRLTPPNARETVANQLAGRLLLPWAWFAADAPACGWDLVALKAQYRTASHELIARRMLELPPPVIVTIFDQGQLHVRLSNVPGRVPPLSADEQDLWQTVHQRNESLETSSGTQTIQGWPVHEPGWKREILRTEVELALVG